MAGFGAPPGYEDPDELTSAFAPPPGYEDPDEPPKPAPKPGILSRLAAAVPKPGTMQPPNQPPPEPQPVGPQLWMERLPTPLPTTQPSVYTPPKPPGEILGEPPSQSVRPGVPLYQGKPQGFRPSITGQPSHTTGQAIQQLLGGGTAASELETELPTGPVRPGVPLYSGPNQAPRTTSALPKTLEEAVTSGLQTELPTGEVRPGVPLYGGGVGRQPVDQTPKTRPGGATGVSGGIAQGLAGLGDALASPEVLGLVVGVPAIASLLPAKAASILSLAVTGKFGYDIAQNVATERATALGDAIGSRDPQRIAAALTAVAGDLAILVHPTMETPRAAEARWRARAEEQRAKGPAPEGAVLQPEVGVPGGPPGSKPGVTVGGMIPNAIAEVKNVAAAFGPKPGAPEPLQVIPERLPGAPSEPPPSAAPAPVPPPEPAPLPVEPPAPIARPAVIPPESVAPAPQVEPPRVLIPPGPAPAPEIHPESHEIGAAPQAVPGDRWESDRGAIPGEPMGVLDGGKAAIVEIDTPRGAHYEARDSEGVLIGRFTGVEEAARAAEAWVDEKAPESELARRAELKKNPPTEEEIRLSKEEEENVPAPPEPKEAPEPRPVPGEGPAAAAGVGGEAPPGYVEVTAPGEGLPEHEPAPKSAEPEPGAPGGRAGGGAEDRTGELTTESFDQTAYRKFKAGLARALKVKDWKAVLVNVKAFEEHFDESPRGYPDDWQRWQRAKDDAQIALGIQLDAEQIGEKPTEPPAKPAFIAQYSDAEHGVDYEVHRLKDGRYSVITRDRDSGKALPSARIFGELDPAVQHAKDLFEKGKGKAPETTLPSAAAVTQPTGPRPETKLDEARAARDLEKPAPQGETPEQEDKRRAEAYQVHPEAVRKLREAMDAGDIDKLNEYLDKSNPRLRALFTKLTGVSLPKLSGSRRLSLKEWAKGVEDAKVRVAEREKLVAPAAPEGHIEEGEQNAPPLETPHPVGAPGEGALEEARPEALRGPEKVGETPRGPAQRSGAGEGSVREDGPSGGRPGRGAEGGGEQPPSVRPGERPGERGALGEEGGGGQRPAGDEKAPLGAKSETEPERKVVSAGEATLESHPTSSNSGTDFGYASAEDAEAESAGGARSRVAANVEALRILETVKTERRPATAAEQAALAKFSGWGSFPGLFRYGSDLYDQGEIVRKLIGEDAWDAAERSVLNAHYTAPRVVAAMWEMAKRLGVKGGRILEPSMGIGNFFALMPPEIRGKSRLTGVELDTSTGEMAQLLYPNANIEVKGYEDLKVPDGFFDFAISNVPFGDYRVHDREYNRYAANIHDYFILKTLDKVRPGGAIAVITSTGTMDKNLTRIREAMIEKGADLVAAIRLPAETFQKAAGTSVVTDILILKKRGPGEPAGGQEWTVTKEVPDPGGGAAIPVNEYYVAHPEQILGRLDRSGTMYRGQQINVARQPDFEEKFKAAIARLPQNIIEPRKASSAFDPKLVQSASNARFGSSVVQNGKLYVSLGDVMREVAADQPTVARVGKMLEIRDVIRELYDAQLAGKGDAAVQEARSRLGTSYDAFVKRYGPISSPKNLHIVADDPDTPYILKSLERLNPESKKIEKTDIFTKDTVASYKKAETAASAGDAVSILLREKGALDIEEMAKLLGKTEVEVGKELVGQGLAFDDPKEGWTEKSLYVSGNVRRKLAEAQAAAKVDPRYAPNVTALEAAQPKDLDFTEIHAPLGAPWILDSDHVDFMQSLIGGRPTDFQADFEPTQGRWFFKYTTSGMRHRGRQPDTKLWGTERVPFLKIIEAAANGQLPQVRKPHPTEDDKTVVDVEETAAANQKVDDVKRAFEDWLWEDPDRRRRLHRYYNDNFNNLQKTDYNASHYKDEKGNYHFPGMNPAVSLYPHQANFVWQAVTTGRGSAGHEVGTGKTIALATIAMEWRRLGLSRKPVIATTDSAIGGFAEQFRATYPAARIIVTGSGLDAKERRETLARAASGDWDAVLMTHENLDKLKMRPEVEKKYINEQLDDLRAAKMAAHEKDPKKDNRIVKQLEKAEARLEARLHDLIEGKTEKDVALYFEQLGGDSLLVDEAHKYKSLPVYTAMENLKGVPQDESQRATNMLMRTRWLQEQNGGRGVVFATGTPIDNSLAELYNLQRYLQPKELRERGIQSFDAWAKTFTTSQTQMEMKATGDYAPETRLSAFVNVPDLQQLAAVVLDVKRAADVGQIIRPHRKDELVTVPMSDLGRQYLDVLRQRADAIRKRGRLEKGESGDTFLAITNDAAEAATDIRRVVPGAPDEPGSKVNTLVRNVLQIHKENPGKTQLIFSDRGVHPTARGGQSTYKDIIRKLVKGGIPADKIINFSDVGKTGKEAAVNRLKTGDALIAIGGSQTLGTGVNVQDKLIAAHHLDVPWTPARLEQRNGRIWRKGNENTHIRIIPYVTEGSFDANMWEAVNRKSKFIAQFMEGKFKGRTFEDPDTEKLSYAQIMAQASGSPELLEKINVEEDVRKLERAKKQHQKIQAELQDSLATSARQIAEEQERIAKNESAAARLSAPHEKFTAEVGGKQYTDRAAAGKAVAPLIEKTRLAQLEVDRGYDRDNVRTPLGTYRGEAISLVGMRNTGGSVYFETPVFGMAPFDTLRPESIFQSFDSRAALIPHWIEASKAQIATIEAAAAKAKEAIGKSFKDDERLERMKKRLPELDTIVKTKMEAAKKAREGQPVNPMLAEELSRTVGQVHAPPEPAAAAGAPNPKAFYGFTEAGGYIETRGRKIEFPEHPGLEFFVHKEGGDWKVSEARSGLHLGVRERSQLAATAAARKILGNTTPESLKSLIEKHVEKHGPSPRYPKEYEAFQKAHPEPAGEPEPMVKGEDGVYRVPEKTETAADTAREVPPEGDVEDRFAATDAAVGIFGDIFGTREPGKKTQVEKDPLAAGRPEVEERLAAAEKGLASPTVLEKVKAAGASVAQSFRRHFRHIDSSESTAMALTQDILRQYEAAPQYAKAVASDSLAYVVEGLDKDGLKVFRRILALRDLARSVEEGLYDEKDLPFGYESLEEAQTDLKKYEMVADLPANPALRGALARREKIATDLTERLVDHDLLPPDVLKDSRYYHRQVLSYFNMRDPQFVGTGAPDVRLHRKGFQKERVGGSDFNMKYQEAEFEWMSQALALLQTSETLRRLEGTNNIAPGLRAQAKHLNEVAVFGGIEKWNRAQAIRRELVHLAEEDVKDSAVRLAMKTLVEELAEIDPLRPFRIRKASAMEDLGTMAEDGRLSHVPSEHEAAVAELGGMHGEALEDGKPGFFALLNYLVGAEGKPGSVPAARFFKAVADQAKFIKDTLGKNFKTFEDLIPDQHPAAPQHRAVVWQPEKGNRFYLARTFPERALTKLEEALAAGVPGVSAEDVQAFLEKGREALVRGGKKEEWVIPENLATTLDNWNQGRAEEGLEKVQGDLLTTWKQWVLLNPVRALKYNLNNESGDLDAVMAAYPGALKEFQRAAADLWRYNVRESVSDQAVVADLHEAMKRGVIGSGQSFQEIPDISSVGAFRALTSENPNIVQKAIQQYWGGTKRFSTWRENVLRLAVYRYLLGRIRAGDKGLYGASRAEEVRAIPGPEDRAAKLSRELLGDYGNISVAGQYLRRHMIPFYSWMEINLPRYVRMFRNAAKEEGGTGGAARGAAVATLKLGHFAIMASLFYAMVQAWNNIVFPEEEKKLGRDRRQLHLILGKAKDGTIRSIRLQGALSDALDWFGLGNVVSDVKEISAGKKTAADVAAEAVKAPADKVVQGWEPLSKTLFELVSGKRAYPSIFKDGTKWAFSSRPIRDRAEFLADTIWPLGDLYRRVTGKPRRPAIDLGLPGAGPMLESLLIYKTDPGEAAYWATQDLVRRWKESIGKGGGGAPELGGDTKKRSDALYYFRKASEWGDDAAAKKWLQEYFNAGGSMKSIRERIRHVGPLSGLALKERSKFLSSLRPADRALLKEAQDWSDKGREAMTRKLSEGKFTLPAPTQRQGSVYSN